MSKVFSNTIYKPFCEKTDQPKKIFKSGLGMNIVELNYLIGLLDRSFEDIRLNLDGMVDSSTQLNFMVKDKNQSHSSSNAIETNYSDAARVTQDLDHLLTSLSQYKLNQTSATNIYNKNDTDDIPVYLYSEQLPNNYVSSNGASKDVNLGNVAEVLSPKTIGSSIPICVRCNEPIYDNSLCALDGYWHQHHFMCRGCDLRLENQVYYVDNDQPFCEMCHINMFTDKCAYCGEPILDTSLTALEQYWHPEHFFCSSCQGPFNDNIGFHEQEGKPFCSECFFDLFGHRCGGCNGPITTTFLTALGKKWHNECFVCSDCHSEFETTNFRELNGSPYCELHYHMKMGTICSSCNEPIIGSLVSALGRKYHVDCFTCSYCIRRLAKSSFKESNNRPYCTECFTKLCP